MAGKMINGLQVKICGLTTLADAGLADRAGADYLGFILWPQSPRGVTLAQFLTLAPRLPARRKVAVAVSPSAPELAGFAAAGFDYFQIHFPHDAPLPDIQAWSDAVGARRLWLAPKRPPGTAFDPAWLALADTFLIDTYQPQGFGGSGQTGDWAGFAALRRAHPGKAWILSGGLNPGNIAAAVAATGARAVDVNSGVERSPGVKDEGKIQALFAALARLDGSPQRGASQA